MITGKTCSADVEVVVDANVLVLPHVAFDNLAASHSELLRGMVQMLGERLHTTNVRGAIAAEPVVTLLRVERSWAAPAAFSDELGRSLARQMNADTLVVTLGDPDRGIRPIGPQAFSVGLDAPNASAARAVLARALTQWRSRFPFILLNLREDRGFSPPDVLAPLANITGELLGAGAQPVLTTKAPRHFVVSSERGGLPWLSGARQIARDAAESERRYLAGEPTTAPFRRTVDSIARHIAGVQVGLALGGGAAWGLAHIGVLAALERSGVPVDVVSGCSMGSVVGAMRCAGHTPAEMVEIAETLGRKKRRFVEPRIWQLHLLSEREVRKMLLELLEDRALEELELPLWMNALDLATAEELSLKDGPVWEAVRAAIAMPGLLPPLKRGNRLLVDAGFIDPVPVSQVRSMGCRYAIAVNAMQPPGGQKIIERYPLYNLDVLYRCLLVTGYELGEARCRRVADVVIEPRVGEISWLEFHRTHELVHAGERAAEAQMSSILGGYERLKALCLPVWPKN
jgi:NTE family protein